MLTGNGGVGCVAAQGNGGHAAAARGVGGGGFGAGGSGDGGGGGGGAGAGAGAGGGGGLCWWRVTLTPYSKISPKIDSVAPGPLTVALAFVTVTSDILECDQTPFPT